MCERTITNKASKNKGTNANNSPLLITYTTIPQVINAINAVKNQPEITVNTPVIRYTALSRPHAPSANELAIATINVTYVVERGSLNEVPIVISILATIRFRDARNISNDAASFTVSVDF